MICRGCRAVHVHGYARLCSGCDKVRTAKIIAAVESGATLKDIGAVLEVSKSRAEQVLAEMALTERWHAARRRRKGSDRLAGAMATERGAILIEAGQELEARGHNVTVDPGPLGHRLVVTVDGRPLVACFPSSPWRKRGCVVWYWRTRTTRPDCSYVLVDPSGRRSVFLFPRGSETKVPIYGPPTCDYWWPAPAPEHPGSAKAFFAAGKGQSA